MAAIVCDGIGKVLNLICCKAPCKVCSLICEVFAAPCKVLGCIFNGPLSGYLLFTLAIQIPSLVYSIRDGLLVIYDNDECKDGGGGSSKIFTWLIGIIVTSIVHIVASLYLVIRIRNSNDEGLSNYTSGFDRATYLLCRDVWMAIYILVFIYFFVWLILGSSWIYDDDNDCNIDRNNLTIVLILGWCYFGLAPISLGFSLCCTACCDGRDYTAGGNNAGTTSVNNSIGNPAAPAVAASTGVEIIDDGIDNKKDDNGRRQKKDDKADEEIPMAHAEIIPTAPAAEYDDNRKQSAAAAPKNNEGDENTDIIKKTLENATNTVNNLFQNIFDNNKQQSQKK